MRTGSDINFKGIFIITSVHLLALGVFFFNSWQAVMLWLLAHIFFCSVGISLAQHRYLSHGAVVPRPWFGKVLALTATLCFQGGPLFWPAAHRAHHKHNENKGDPHAASKGFLYSHMTWMFRNEPNGFNFTMARRLIPDLMRVPFLRFLEKHAAVLNYLVLGGAFAALLMVGRLDIFFWVFPFRIVTVWHATWMINSFSHGLVPFRPRQSPLRDSMLMNFILWGDGFHKTHHERPLLVKLSSKWYHLDTSYLLIRLFEKVKLLEIREEMRQRSQKPAVVVSRKALS